jgi:hypothetical protein
VATVLIAPLLNAGGAAAAPLRTELRLTSFKPISVDYGKQVRASGTFTTNQTIDDVVIRFEVGGSAFISRSSLSEAASTPPYTYPVAGAEDDLRKVKHGETESFSIKFPSNDLPFDTPGVYPMKVVALDAATLEELGSVSSFLPWAPDGVGIVPSRLLMIWPIIGDTDLVTGGPDGSVDRNTLLGQTISGVGRLATLVNAGQRAPATWVVDPAVLDQAAELDSPAAQSWLDAVAERAGQKQIVALPYGDPDVAAVAAADRPGFLVQGQTKADRVVNRVLGSVPQSDVAWPADGAGNEDTIATAGRARDAFVLLDEQNAPLVTPQTFTPSERIAWSDPNLDVLLADESASALMASPAITPSDVLLARQRFLAETLLHSREFADPRLLVVAPPRRWDPSPLWAEALVDAVRHANWLNSVSLDQAVEPTITPFERQTPSIPEDAAARQLPSSMVFNAQSALTDNRRLAAILARPGRITPPIEDDLFTSLSTAWRSDPVAADTSQHQTIDQLETLRGKVRIVSQGGTLSNDRGSFPVTIRNQLDQRVAVRLNVNSTDPLRLRVNGPEQVIHIPPQGSVSRAVDLDAVTSGRLSFDAQLRTPRGAAYSDPVTVAVDVRGFGRITLLVFGAAVALLMVAAGIRIFRRIHNARRRAS